MGGSPVGGPSSFSWVCNDTDLHEQLILYYKWQAFAVFLTFLTYTRILRSGVSLAKGLEISSTSPLRSSTLPLSAKDPNA